MAWIDDILLEHSEVESPTAFWYWAALCSVSAVVKDNIWIDRAGLYKLYPNIYCILHAESGMKKGPPIAMAKDLVRLVGGTRLISGRSSVQGIMKKLGTAHTEPNNPRPLLKSVGFIVASELSSAIVEDPAALTILTDLYDRHYNKDEWESLLKVDSFQLKDPTVSLLGGINDAHADTFFGKKDIQGGFLARTFVVYEKEEQNINSLVKPLTHVPNLERSACYLKEVAKLKGPFKPFWDEETNKPTAVGAYYDEWYNDFRKQVKMMEIKDDTGTLNRFGDSVLKVAMLLSLAKNPVLEITMEAMEDAIEHSEKLIGNIRQTTMGKRGLSTSAEIKKQIIWELYTRTNHQISRPMLMKKMWMHYSNETEFTGVMQAFHDSGLIVTQSMGNQIVYTMPDEQVKEMKRYLEGKMRK